MGGGVAKSSHLFRKVWSLYLNKTSFDGLHVALLEPKGDTPTSNWILVLVRVNPGVDHAPKQIVHYVCQGI